MTKFVKAGDLVTKRVSDRLSRQVISGEKMTLVRITLGAGHLVPAHEHPHEQMGFVLTGTVRLSAGGQTEDLGPGSMYAIDSGVKHSAQALGTEPAELIEVFTPIREDFLA